MEDIRDVVEDTVPIRVATMTTTKWWLGRRRRTVELRTWQAGSRYCGFPFERGHEYVVYAWSEKRLHTDACTRTRPIEAARSDEPAGSEK